MRLNRLAIGLLAATSASIGARTVFAQQEIMLGGKVAASAPNEVTIVWSETPALPAAATEDLVDLRAAVVALGHAAPAILVNKNGRSAAVMESRRGGRPDPATPSGVAVWPDWQIADARIDFADVSQVQFLSGNHILISQHPDGGPYVSFIVDIRRPTTRFQFSGYQLDTLRVTDSGKWAALAMDGSLSGGQLNAAGPAEPVTGATIPVGNAARNLIWRLDGRFLLVERDGPVIDVLNSANWSVVSSISGGLGPNKGTARPIGRDSCFGYQPGIGSSVFTVSSSGTISAVRWPSQVAGETSVFISPLRKFLITQKTDEDQFVPRFCRKTPFASEEDVIPAWPEVPQGTKIQGVGWLLWTP